MCAIGLASIAVGGGCRAEDEHATSSAGRAALVLRADVEPVRSVADARPGVFIPPFTDCRAPLDGQPGQGPDAQVCTQVAISGCTEAGRYFPAYAACDVVRTQRPYWPAPPARASRADDPRLQDDAFTGELAWAATQVEASGCACCHDSRVISPSQWDIRAEPIWLDSLSDSGLALFVGLADSSVLGAYPAEHNNGFERDQTGLPSNDAPRMRTFLLAELQRRGISEAEAAAVPPFGGPIYQNRIAKPTLCRGEEGIAPDGSVLWKGGPARYVYVTDGDGDNPGVPPNLDLPQGTRWRLDVLASEAGVESGSIVYGATPAGSFQMFPQANAAQPLTLGQSYRLYVLRDVGVPLANCSFVFGDSRAAEPAAQPSAMMCDAGEADAGFGTPCSDATTHRECGCAAPYCAIQPGRSEGYCTATGCVERPDVCPAGWSCFDLSQFQSDAPSVCLAPS